MGGGQALGAGEVGDCRLECLGVRWILSALTGLVKAPVDGCFTCLLSQPSDRVVEELGVLRWITGLQRGELQGDVVWIGVGQLDEHRGGFVGIAGDHVPRDRSLPLLGGWLGRGFL